MVQSPTIALTGDVMLGRHVDEVIARRGTAYPWGDLTSTLREADLLLVNLECALTDRRDPGPNGGPKRFSFRADPERGAAVLAQAGVDFAALANNHVEDFGPDGLLDTLAALDGAGIAHAGAGMDLAAARVPARLTVGELRVAVVAIADYPAEWAASPHGPGIDYVPISTAPRWFTSMEELVSDARQESDLVIVSAHWGPNMRARPTPAFRAFARRVIDAGADVFWGHSAHVVQGVEVWNGRPILYDTGDFLDDYAVDPALRNDRSALFLLRVVPPAIERIDLLPVEIEACQVNRAGKEGRTWVARWLEKRCAELGTELDEQSDGLTIELPRSR